MSNWSIFKFGGASVKDPEALRNAVRLVRDYGTSPLLVVVSAMGKTTNALERYIQARELGDASGAAAELAEIKVFHEGMARELGLLDSELRGQLDALWAEAEHVDSAQAYNPRYDAVVSLGELASSRILAAALRADGQPTAWLDAREVVRTDAEYRRATVNWSETAARTQRALAAPAAVTVTQGFIGSAPDGSTTTLGREGSDYSAAIFANVLKASSLSIWKDVPGMLSGDPKVFTGVVRLEQVPYREAIELAFYGASIIHPKTIQPLEQGGTTLRIRSFVDPEAPGTEVGPFAALTPEVPCWIRHENQVLIDVSSRDLSFLSEGHLSEVYRIFAEEGLLVRAAQHTALSTRFAVNDDRVAVPRALERLNGPYRATAEYGLRLTTVRRPDAEAVATLLAGGPLRLVLRNHEVAQVLTAPN
ncbi:MAG: aspartate kinase [Schleiferiaceae bacterium]